MQNETTEEEWKYDAFRVGRATRTVEVAAAGDETSTIKEGQIQFDPINEEDHWMWEEDEWTGHYVSPDGGIGFSGGVAVPFDKLGIIEFPYPMTDEEAGEWLNEDEDRWRQFLDENLESDVTAEDYVGEVL